MRSLKITNKSIEEININQTDMPLDIANDQLLFDNFYIIYDETLDHAYEELEILNKFYNEPQYITKECYVVKYNKEETKQLDLTEQDIKLIKEKLEYVI